MLFEPRVVYASRQGFSNGAGTHASTMATVCCDSSHVQSLHNLAKQCTELLQVYKWLTESFTLDFFNKDHWKQLPTSWAVVLEKEPIETLGKWLSSEPHDLKQVFPLSLLAFRASAATLTLGRKPVRSTRSLLDYLGRREEVAQDWESSTHLLAAPSQEKLLTLFRKHVKPKKRHEVVRLAGACAQTAKTCQCASLVDVGAGVGHLSRMLAYGHGLQVCCLEAKGQFNGTAQKLDAEFQMFFHKNQVNLPAVGLAPPQHVTLTLRPNSHASELREVLGTSSRNNVGLIGLHTCGDLGPTLIRLFAESSDIIMLCSVACCYMKIENKASYPVSQFVLSLPNHQLSYEAKEIACHAIEMYCQRLSSSQNYENYRAALEVLLQRRGIVRAGLKGVKNAHLMPFECYAALATEKMGVAWDSSELCSPELDGYLKQWKNVVIFYTLRLVLAPVIETVLLLDRIFYLYEQGYPSCLIPLFDPVLSPRNMVLVAVKPAPK